eukprot:GHVU01156441.1.p2 GENE.GHVU01156441.1~~GHVU01156441.1.p2  ORF type:complete len:103 (-),score=12.47 GHVU01156441.1:12-320(-)
MVGYKEVAWRLPEGMEDIELTSILFKLPLFMRKTFGSALRLSLLYSASISVSVMKLSCSFGGIEVNDKVREMVWDWNAREEEVIRANSASGELISWVARTLW